MQSRPTERFEYRLGAARMVVMGIIAIALPMAFANMASSNHVFRFRGMTFSPDEAAVFLWIMAVLSALTALMIFWGIWRNIRSPHFLELGATEAVLPRATIRNNLMSVPYRAIQGLQVVPLPGGGRMAIVATLQGEARFGTFGFKSEQEFERFVLALRKRLGSP